MTSEVDAQTPEIQMRYIAGFPNIEQNKQLSDMASVALSFARRSETFNMTFSLFTCNVKYIHHRGLNHKQRKTKQTSHSKRKHKLLEGKSEIITCSGKHLCCFPQISHPGFRQSSKCTVREIMERTSTKLCPYLPGKSRLPQRCTSKTIHLLNLSDSTTSTQCLPPRNIKTLRGRLVTKDCICLSRKIEDHFLKAGRQRDLRYQCAAL